MCRACDKPLRPYYHLKHYSERNISPRLIAPHYTIIQDMTISHKILESLPIFVYIMYNYIIYHSTMLINVTSYHYYIIIIIIII